MAQDHWWLGRAYNDLVTKLLQPKTSMPSDVLMHGKYMKKKNSLMED